MTTALERLLAILPTPPVPGGPASEIEGVVVDGDTAWVSGVVAFNGAEKPKPGKVGLNVTVVDGAQHAAVAAANGLHRLEQVLGSLDRIDRILKLTVFVNATEDLTEHPQVANGASRVLREVLGDRGRHARSAIGCASLPLGAPVEIEMIVRVLP